MTHIEDLKALGFKQMHQMQIDCLVGYISSTVNLAASIGDQDIIEEIEAQSDELIKMFGGNGLKVSVDLGVL